MIYLYHGTPGSGKTNFIVEKILKDVEEQGSKPFDERRPIFANIMGLDIDGVLPPPDDFRECPVGSIIYYDEAQEIAYYSSDSRAVNPVAKSLSVHRSRYGMDIHFITQDPSLLHKYVLKNTSLHTYLWRPANRKSIDVYIWTRAIVNPTKSDFKNAYDTKKRTLNLKCFDYYDSTPMDTHKKIGSSKKWNIIFYALIIFGVLGYFIVPFFFSSDKDSSDKLKQSDKQNPKPNNQPASQPKNYPKPQYKQVSYNPQHDLTDYKYLHYLESKRITAVFISGKRCKAYNSFGFPIPATVNQCKDFLKNPTPSYFNYLPNDNASSNNDDAFNDVQSTTDTVNSFNVFQ